MASKNRQIERWTNLKQPNLINLQCPLCEYNESINNYKKYMANDIFCAGIIIRHQCPYCDLLFGDLRFLYLTEEQIQHDHDDTYSYFTEGDGYISQLECLNSISIFKDKTKSFLDYACGIGKLTHILKNDGYNITGYDKYVKHENVLNNINDMKFDVVFSTNFIEHLINPLEDIKKMLVHLNNDGYLIFISGCIDEYLVEFTHFHVFII